jgi:hypothetical protein
MTEHERAALHLIAGCPDGVTGDALAQHGHTISTMAALAARGLISHRVIRLGNPKHVTLVRFWVTTAGLRKIHR